MPLYLYSCHTCELELEELHPLGQAPLQSIRCPLCGGFFIRDVALFHVNGRKAAPAANRPEQSVRHGINCLCCMPRSARRSAGYRNGTPRESR